MNPYINPYYIPINPYESLRIPLGREALPTRIPEALPTNISEALPTKSPRRLSLQSPRLSIRIPEALPTNPIRRTDASPERLTRGGQPLEHRRELRGHLSTVTLGWFWRKDQLLHRESFPYPPARVCVDALGRDAHGSQRE